MRIASFNVENLFERAKALNQAPWYDTMTKPIHAASDHAAIHADISL